MLGVCGRTDGPEVPLSPESPGLPGSPCITIQLMRFACTISMLPGTVYVS